MTWTPFRSVRSRHPIELANGTYRVRVRTFRVGKAILTRLAIARLDGRPVRKWLDLQRIKNEVAGPERVAVEVFPQASKVDMRTNELLLWVLPAWAEGLFLGGGA